ncbi:hypothetical protein [Anaerovibrio lipolyticus]|nr:hypothetical protein [Anaerovibrio lipolyticus]
MNADTSSVRTVESHSGVLRSQGTAAPLQYLATVLRDIPRDLAILR